MSRDPNKLRVFHDAHRLALAIYKCTKGFPRDEWFGLRGQIRPAAVSVPSNIVEGSARSGPKEHLKFIYVALGSACELKYLVALTRELGYASESGWIDAEGLANSVVRQLQALVREVGRLVAEERSTMQRRVKTKRRTA